MSGPSPSALLDRAHPAVGGLSPYQPGKPISELKREYGVEDVIKMASNESPIGPSPRAIEAAGRVLASVAEYPDGNGFELKAALARKHGVMPVQVTLGNGSNELLELIARIFLGPGRNAVISAHAFAIYELVSCVTGAQVKVARAFAPAHPRAYGHDLEAMAQELDDDTAVVFIANPNNPTGTWNTAAELQWFLGQVPPHVAVVLDEAYFDYVEAPEYPDGQAYLAHYPNLLVTRTFSKAFGLAGLRVGYGLSHPDLADLLNRIRQPFNVNNVAQAAALAALGDEGHLARAREVNRLGLRRLEQGLAALGLNYLPSVANFLCFQVPEAGRVFEALLREGVIVRPLHAYGLREFLRVSVGTESQNDRFLNTLQGALKQ